MAYLGNSPVLSQQEYRNIDNISGSFNGVTTSFALLVNGVAPVPAPQSSNQCLISVNGVVQKPDDTGATGFRLSGGNIIFSSAPTGGQSFFGVILAGSDYIYAGQNFPDGTVSAPSITFNQDLDTGFYRSGAGEVKYTANGANAVTFSSNGLTASNFVPSGSTIPTNGVYLPSANNVAIATNSTQRLLIDSSGQIEAVSLGTAAAPTWSFTTDPNTGIYSPGADQLAISTNGSGRLFVDASGNIGINTSPSSIGTSVTTLEIKGGSTTRSGGLRVSSSDSSVKGAFYIYDGAGVLGTESATPLDLYTGNSPRLRITSAGLVGIGTSSVGAVLHTKGAGGSSSGSELLRLETGQATGGNWISFWDGSARKGYIGYKETTDENIYITNEESGGNVIISGSAKLGIGTASPAYNLSIFNNSNNFVQFAATGDAVAGSLIGRASSTELRVQNSENAATTFWTNNTERARIDSSGRLLVGTSTSPSSGNGQYSPLVIQGYIGGSTGEGGISIQRGQAASSIVADTAIGVINFNDNAGNTFANIIARGDATAGTNDYPGRLVFSTTADGASSPTERMRISQNGVVTIKNGAVAEIGTLTDGATITPDFAANCNFTVTLGGNRTLANPTNVTAGQSGSIFIIQDATGSRTLSWGSNWDWAAGTAPTLTTTANAVDRVDYVCRSATSIHAVFTSNYS